MGRGKSKKYNVENSVMARRCRKADKRTKEHIENPCKYEIGQIVNEKFKIIQIFKDDLRTRYLCVNIKAGYKEMFWEEDINENKGEADICDI